jgi:threonyl-tRNA synthetase
MRVMQLDVNSIAFEPTEPEIRTHEPAEKKKVSVKNALVLLASVERGDTEAFASKAVKDAVDFAGKNKITTVVLYPYAHLSSNLEEPQRSMNLYQYMVKEAEKSNLKIIAAPFGWTKALSIDIKGHPLAELSRNYGATSKAEKVQKGTRKVDTAIVRKSDFVGLPETDHRVIGERLNLFSFQEVSPGMVYWHHNGYIIVKELIRFIRERLDRAGYQEIAAPSVANLALWHVSGHIDHYRENMFVIDNNGEELGLKPMGCPSAMLIYMSRKWSYRDLPARFSDFDKLYRNEISGALSGLFRVREITQDDAHLFVREDQIEDELVAMLKLVDEFYSKFNLPYKAKLSTMPDSHIGDEKLWEKATGALRKALKDNGMKYEVKEREGAFYGPKIDFDIKDSLGREWQCATVQIDYQQPQRFGLTYTGEDGREHMPVVLHRVIYGSLERFLGVYIEHVQGKFPAWLAPVQVRVITISEHANKHAEEVYKKLRKERIRAELDISDKTLDYKIRDAQNQKIPYMLILGKKETESGKISIRSRSGKQKLGVGLDEFVSDLEKEIGDRKNELML